ncbi:hypothetical protein ABZP36_012394 [Zizania latifolia]
MNHLEKNSKERFINVFDRIYGSKVWYIISAQVAGPTSNKYQAKQTKASNACTLHRQKWYACGLPTRWRHGRAQPPPPLAKGDLETEKDSSLRRGKICPSPHRTHVDVVKITTMWTAMSPFYH